MAEEIKTNDAVNALQRIRKAEEKARRIIQEAREKKAAKIIQDANDEVKKIKERHLDRARKKAEEKKRIIIQQAAKEAEEIRKNAEEEAVSLKIMAEKAMTKAVNQASEKIKKLIEKGEL